MVSPETGPQNLDSWTGCRYRKIRRFNLFMFGFCTPHSFRLARYCCITLSLFLLFFVVVSSSVCSSVCSSESESFGIDLLGGSKLRVIRGLPWSSRPCPLKCFPGRFGKLLTSVRNGWLIIHWSSGRLGRWGFRSSDSTKSQIRTLQRIETSRGCGSWTISLRARHIRVRIRFFAVVVDCE